MKMFIKKNIRRIVSVFPLSNIILFESAPDFSDNTKAVFDEMITKGIDNKYKLIWLCFGKNKIEFDAKNKNVKFIQVNTKLSSIKMRYLLCRAKAVICCNYILPSYNTKQKVFYLTHGTPIKSVRSYYTIPDYVDYCTIPSNGVMSIHSYEFNYPKERMVSLGFPRNDLLGKQIDIKTLLQTNCEKVIVWYPTFRQTKTTVYVDVKYALPVIHDSESAKRLNEVAAKNNTLIVLKPHFAQDVSYIKDLRLSNIRFIDDSFFAQNNISSYEFVGSCDALITDYSSIYYDFTLCDKPIAAIWEDIEEYKQKPGLIENYEYYMKGAEKIYTVEELEKFVSDVANGVDNLKEERNEIKNLTNYSNDGKNSARVVDFIIEKARL